MTLQPIGIVFPDVEAWACDYFRDALTARLEPVATGVHVDNTVPNPRADRMVIVRRDGGTSNGLRDQARLSVRCWAENDEDATDLARLIAALLWVAPDGDPVLMVRQQSGPTPVPDDSHQSLRYLVFDVHTRGEVL